MKLNKACLKIFLGSVVIIISFALITNGCGNKKQADQEAEENAQNVAQKVVKAGDKIQIHFISRLENGTVVGGTKKDAPFQFVVGGGGVIPGLERAVLGMALDEQRTVNIPVELAYGKRREGLTRDFTRSELPGEVDYKKGMILKLTDANDREVPGIIMEVSEDTITVDLNHPLAGRSLIYTIKIVGIE